MCEYCFPSNRSILHTSRMGESVESALSALAAIFRLLARILTISHKKCHILTCRDKRESYLVLLSLWLSLALTGSLSPCLSLAPYGSLWLPLWLSLALTATLWHTLALSGLLLLSNFANTVLDWLSEPLLGSQRRCHPDARSPALHTRRHYSITLPYWFEILTSLYWSFLDRCEVARILKQALWDRERSKQGLPL